MDKVDYNKILEELIEIRKNMKRLVTSVAPQRYVGSLISGGSQGIEPNFDFTSLYPSTMTMRFPGKNNIRKKKIKKIFTDI